MQKNVMQGESKLQSEHLNHEGEVQVPGNPLAGRVFILYNYW
jgi:hypothetical protein